MGTTSVEIIIDILMKGGICTVEDFIKSNVNNFYERLEKTDF